MPDPERSPELSELEALLSSKESAAVLDAVLGSIPSGAIIVRAPDGKVLRVSDYKSHLLGWPRSELEGHTYLARQPAYDASGRPFPEDERPMARALRGETVAALEVWFETPHGERIPCTVDAAPIRNWRGELIGAIGSFADLRPQKVLEQNLREALAQREEATAQREALYRDLVHRVKNHLQIMTSLLALEARDPELSTRELSEQMKGRLQTLAAVYRGMDRAEAGGRIEARTFVEEVCSPYASDVVSMEVTVAPADLTLTSERAGPLGLLVNEAVRNSSERLVRGSGGRIQVSLRRLEPGRLRLEIAAAGAEPGPVEPGHVPSGQDLMRMFAQQLHGELRLSDRDALGGAMIAVELPEAAE